MSKSAMQELIDKIQLLKELGVINPIAVITIIAERLIEKEKEQIEDAYWDGGQDVPTNGDRCQEYYNQTYNQNK